MPITTRSATCWFDGGQWVDVPAGTPVRLVDDVAVALAGDEHRQGLVLGQVSRYRAAGIEALIVTLKGRVRVLPKSMLVNNGR